MRALALVLLVLWGAATGARACEVPADLGALTAALLDQTNAARAAAGQPALVADAQLTQAAQDHACTNARRERVSHRGSWFAGLARRLRRVDYPYAMAVENLAAGQRSVAEVVTGWGTSPEHRANLLSPDARQVGFGVARAGDGWLHWVMIGAARR